MKRKVLLLVVAVALVVTSANAQTVAIATHTDPYQAGVHVFTAGLLTADLNAAGDLELGGNGWTGLLRLMDADGDIGANLNLDNLTLGNSLGTVGWGSIRIYNSAGTDSLYLDGYTGDITNPFAGNGLAKAWARINADGTIASCWNCNTAITETQRLSTGAYEVDFAIATDISSRPWTCSLGHGGVAVAIGEIGCVGRTGDESSIFVDIRDATGAVHDDDFTIIIF